MVSTVLSEELTRLKLQSLTQYLTPSYLLVLLLLLACAYLAILTLRVNAREEDTAKVKPPLFAFITCVLLTVLAVLYFRLIAPFFSWFTLIYFALVCLASFLFQSFQKIVTGVVVGLLLLTITTVLLLINSVQAYTGACRIADLTVLEKTPNDIVLRIDPRRTKSLRHSQVLIIRGNRIGVVIKQIVFSDLPVFLGAKTAYSWLGVKGYGASLREQDYQRFPDRFHRAVFYDFFARHEKQLSFIKSVQTDVVIKRVWRGRRLGVFVENDGGVTLRPL